MILYLEDYCGNTIGALRITENNINGEAEVKEIKGNISYADKDIDTIFNTNETMIRIQLNE